MSDFDPLQAARDVLVSLVGVERVLVDRERAVEQRFAEAESEMLALRKLRAFATQLVADQRAKVQRLTDEH